MANPIPSIQDQQNYSYDCKTSPFYACPEKFLRMGQRVRAKFRIYDLPNSGTNDWGWVTAEPGMEGTVLHVEEGYWPTVRFDNGIASCVTDFEVEPV